MKTFKLGYGILLLAVIAILAISLPLLAAEKADKDGDIKVTLQDLPPAVRATLQQTAGAGEIEEIEKEASGIYSADVMKDGQKFDIEIAADGKLIKNEVDKEDECKGKDDDKDEVTVTLNDVPAAVAATILNQAGGGTIDEIEKETKHGKTVYEADIIRDGKKLEVKVAEDGTLLKSKVEDEKEEAE